jgi:hypothetical protein
VKKKALSAEAEEADGAAGGDGVDARADGGGGGAHESLFPPERARTSASRGAPPRRARFVLTPAATHALHV